MIEDFISSYISPRCEIMTTRLEATILSGKTENYDFIDYWEENA